MSKNVRERATHGGGKTAAPPPLKLNGKPLEVASTPPSVQKFRSYLDTLPADELFTSTQLIQDGKANKELLTVCARTIPEYRVFWNNKNVWGSPAAVEAFRKQVAE